MTVASEILGRFIDATVEDPATATQLLQAHPGLRDATWLGDERVLHFLVIENFADAVQFCLRNGFDPNQTDGECGNTPLHYAAQLDYPNVVSVLLDHGANPNARSLILNTPLHCCLQNGNTELVDWLLTSGADPHDTTDLGETIFDNWPDDAATQNALVQVLAKHHIHPQHSHNIQEMVTMGHRANFVVIQHSKARAWFDQWAALGCLEALRAGPESAVEMAEDFELTDDLMDWAFAEGGYLLDLDERTAIVFGSPADLSDLDLEEFDVDVDEAPEAFDATEYLQSLAAEWKGWLLIYDDRGVDAFAEYLQSKQLNNIECQPPSHPDELRPRVTLQA